jgi:hypothetical protein
MDWTVGFVETMADTGGNFFGWGFSILDKERRPLLILGYRGETYALAARGLILAALEGAQFVSAPHS